ncbi:integrase [Camelimonas fluminis]|uniref:Tyrosine-type recombinase/integrase n=1 Tax=Camelimonas fluminis TaxID=1576911 RepID=A0ABV7UFY8_9HYPH|nr:site-specific integrase [Camelimonas fluminis]GHE70661.1 integrase [Camelimonas fluminis]
MARALNKLTARSIATLTKPGRHSDGGGLYLAISNDGSRRRWVFLFRFEGYQKELGLGSAALVTLAAAREKARQARTLVEQGINPIRARQEETRTASLTGPSFGEYASAYVNRHSPSWRNTKHIDQWRSTLSIRKDDRGVWIDGGYCQDIRGKQIADITREDIVAILEPNWLGKHETMSRLRGRLETILAAATADRHRSGENPAFLPGLKHLLPKPQKIAAVRHFPAMPYADVPAFIQRLRLVRGMSALALEFLILTAARSGEVRGATWSEIHLAGGLWTIPAARMKAGVEHQVPLTDRAIEILCLVRQLQPVGETTDALVFPGQNRGRPLSDMSLTAVMRRQIDGEFTVHGFRSSFRDWAGDCTPFPREVCEAALAHTTGNAVERAYRRGSALEKRRELMDAWERFCTRSVLIEPALAG